MTNYPLTNLEKDKESRVGEKCTVQYDSIQVVQDDCIQFCDIIKAGK